MPSRSFRCVPVVVAMALAVSLTARPAQAQGWRDRIKKAATDKAGLGGVADAAKAGQILKAFVEARRTPSPLAGTYRVTYTLNAHDSASFYFRTFDKADIPLGYGEEGSTDVDFTRGYLMNLVIARSVDSLPATKDEFKEGVARMRESGRVPGQGFLMSMRDTSTAPGADGRYAVAVQGTLFSADSTEQAFWRRVGSGFAQMGTALNTANEKEAEGTPSATQVKRGDMGPVVDVTAEGPVVLDYDAKTTAGDLVHVHATRLSTVKLIR
jgi:hypothetical protein